MNTPVKMGDPARKQDAQLTEKEKWRLAVGLSAIACGLILAFGLAVFLFGAETTMDVTVGVLALGALVSLGAVACFKTFRQPR